MIPAEMLAKLDALAADGTMHGLTFWPTKDGWQVSLATQSRNNWRVRREATPSESLAAVLGMDFMDADVEPEMLTPPDVDEPELPHEDELCEDEGCPNHGTPHVCNPVAAGVFD